MSRLSSRAAALAVVVAIAALAYVLRHEIARLFFIVRLPAASVAEPGIAPQDLEEKDVEVVAQGLRIPWEILFLPDGRMLVTERPGTLRIIGADGANVAVDVEGVSHVGEGGLLGAVLHPKFSENHWLYLYITAKAGNGYRNRVERYRFESDRLSERTTILQNIPGAQYHDGGELLFGPDGLLYVTTGDASQSALAQDRTSLAGKVLRLKDDGGIPDGNPFGNATWTYGHRNPQGLVWDRQGRLWSTEHGRSGVQSGFDELNLIERGKNYGWPTIEGDETREGMERPELHSGASDTWAPAGIALLDDRLLFGGLRGAALYQATTDARGIVALKEHFKDAYGRLRAVTVGPDGMVYVATSNTDGRGVEREGDDKILKINPRLFR